MTHPDADTLRRFADRELPTAAEESVRLHAGDCDACRHALAELKQEDEWIASLLSTLDAPTPRFERIEPHTRTAHPWLRRAAALLFATSLAGAAWALPGSPLRSWLSSESDVPPPTEAVATEAANTQARGGIEIDARGAIVITFAAPQAAGVVRLSLSDSAVGGLVVLDDDVRLDTPSDGVVNVDNAGSSASYEIHVPRAAADVTVRVGSTTIFRKLRDVITAPAGSLGDGVYVIRLES